MSVRYIEIITSDVSSAEGASARRVPAFDIDLTDEEWAELQRFIDKGRKPNTGGAPAPSDRGAAYRVTSASLREERYEARKWLNSHGYTVGVKGVIAKELMLAYQSKTPAPGWTDPSQTVTPAVTASGVRLVQAKADADLDTVERQRGAHTRKMIPPSAKTAAQMSPAMQAAEKAPQEAAPARKAAAATKATPRASKTVTAAVKTTAPATPRKTTAKAATAKASPAKATRAK